MKLTGKPATARPHEPNLPAYEAFLKGSACSLLQDYAGGLRARRRVFQAGDCTGPAVGRPSFCLGRSLFIPRAPWFAPADEMMPLARAEARKALELFPSEPMAHAVLGAIAAVHDYDWKEAEEQFRLATASEPLPPDVHDMYAVCYLLPLGRFEEAIARAGESHRTRPAEHSARLGSRRLRSLMRGMYERCHCRSAERAGTR